jgi:hypothetical protein
MTIRPIVSHLLDKTFVERASTMLLLGILWIARRLRSRFAVLRDRPLVCRLVSGSYLVFSCFGGARATLISRL